MTVDVSGLKEVLTYTIEDPIDLHNGPSSSLVNIFIFYCNAGNLSINLALMTTGEQGVFMTEVIPGGVADKAGVRIKDRLLQVNGENVEMSTHDEVVEKIKQGGNDIMFLLADEATNKFYQNKQAQMGLWSATVKYLPLQPRIIKITKGSDGYGFLLREEPNQTGKAMIINCMYTA